MRQGLLKLVLLVKKVRKMQSLFQHQHQLLHQFVDQIEYYQDQLV